MSAVENNYASPLIDDSWARSTTHSDFLLQTSPERSLPRPTSNRRHHNPHASTFKSRRMPDGSFLNLLEPTDNAMRSSHGSASDGTLDTRPMTMDSLYSTLGRSSVMSMTTTSRHTFATPSIDPALQGTTTRFGQKDAPWARGQSAPGIVPGMFISKETLTTPKDEPLTTARSSYRSPTMGRRAPIELKTEDYETLQEVVKAPFQAAMEKWMQSAPSFEAAIVKRMLAAVAQQPSVSEVTSPEPPSESDAADEPEEKEAEAAAAAFN